MGHFQGLFDIFKPFFADATTFMQALSVIIASVMAIAFKVREMFADAQEDQMYSQKTKKTFMCLGFVFIIPTIVKIIENYFLK